MPSTIEAGGSIPSAKEFKAPKTGGIGLKRPDFSNMKKDGVSPDFPNYKSGDEVKLSREAKNVNLENQNNKTNPAVEFKHINPKEELIKAQKRQEEKNKFEKLFDTYKKEVPESTIKVPISEIDKNDAVESAKESLQEQSEKQKTINRKDEKIRQQLPDVPSPPENSNLNKDIVSSSELKYKFKNLNNTEKTLNSKKSEDFENNNVINNSRIYKNKNISSNEVGKDNSSLDDKINQKLFSPRPKKIKSESDIDNSINEKLAKASSEIQRDKKKQEYLDFQTNRKKQEIDKVKKLGEQVVDSITPEKPGELADLIDQNDKLKQSINKSPDSINASAARKKIIENDNRIKEIQELYRKEDQVAKEEKSEKQILTERARQTAKDLKEFYDSRPKVDKKEINDLQDQFEDFAKTNPDKFAKILSEFINKSPENSKVVEDAVEKGEIDSVKKTELFKSIESEKSEIAPEAIEKADAVVEKIDQTKQEILDKFEDQVYKMTGVHTGGLFGSKAKWETFKEKFFLQYGEKMSSHEARKKAIEKMAKENKITLKAGLVEKMVNLKENLNTLDDYKKEFVGQNIKSIDKWVKGIDKALSRGEYGFDQKDIKLINSKLGGVSKDLGKLQRLYEKASGNIPWYRIHTRIMNFISRTMKELAFKLRGKSQEELNASIEKDQQKLKDDFEKERIKTADKIDKLINGIETGKFDNDSNTQETNTIKNPEYEHPTRTLFELENFVNSSSQSTDRKKEAIKKFKKENPVLKEEDKIKLSEITNKVSIAEDEGDFKNIRKEIAKEAKDIINQRELAQEKAQQKIEAEKRQTREEKEKKENNPKRSKMTNQLKKYTTLVDKNMDEFYKQYNQTKDDNEKNMAMIAYLNDPKVTFESLSLNKGKDENGKEILIEDEDEKKEALKKKLEDYKSQYITKQEDSLDQQIKKSIEDIEDKFKLNSSQITNQPEKQSSSEEKPIATPISEGNSNEPASIPENLNQVSENLTGLDDITEENNPLPSLDTVPPQSQSAPESASPEIGTNA